MLHRRLADNELWNKKPFSQGQAWVDLLMLANWQDGTVVIGMQPIECKRGQSVRSLETYAKRWGWSKSAVRRFFDLLQKLSMIRSENVTKTTRITICKYESYQEMRNDSETIPKRSRNDPETILAPNEQGNKVRKKKGYRRTRKIKPPAPKAETGKARPRSLDDVRVYFAELESTALEAEKFFDHFTANGWKQGGKAPIKDWKSAARNWVRRSAEFSHKQNGSTQSRFKELK